MGKHLIQAGAVGNHGRSQVAQIPVPEKGQGKPPQGFCQAHPPVGAFLIGCQVERGILKPMKDEQQNKNRQGKAHIDPETLHRPAVILHAAEKVLRCE